VQRSQLSHADRSENAVGVAELAALFADAGAVALACLISPYSADRAAARRLHKATACASSRSISPPTSRSARARSKGLYARATACEIDNLTGVADPYEPPISAELEIPAALDVQSAARAVLAALG